jgi:hypothetical protein
MPKLIAEAVVDVGFYSYEVAGDWVETGYATVRKVISNEEFWSNYTEKDLELFIDFLLEYKCYTCVLKVYEDGNIVEEKVL